VAADYGHRTAEEDLAEAESALRLAGSGGQTTPPEAMALVGIGYALTALVRRQGEFYREVVDVLDQARGD
jgi:hypothetical protein